MSNKIKLTLAQEAYASGYEGYTLGCIVLNEHYEALAKDEDGNEYLVIWKISERYVEGMEEDMACDWENPYIVRHLDTNKDVTENVQILR